MGQEILYCFKCQTRLSTPDFDKGRAVRFGNHVACSDCAPELLRELSPAELKSVFDKRPAKPAPAVARPALQPPSTRHLAPKRPARPLGLYAALAAAGVVAVGLLAFRSKPVSPAPPAPPAAARPAPAPKPVDPLETTRRYVRELGELDAKAAPLLTAEKFGDAAALYESARTRNPGEEWKALLEGKIDGVRREAARLLAGIKEGAATARREGKAEDVGKARGRVERWGLPGPLGELDAALAAVAEERPWRELFDGKTLGLLVEQARSGWRVEDGTIARSELDNAAQTRESFGDGEYRFRFELASPQSIAFRFRQTGTGGFDVGFNRPTTSAWPPGPKELIVRIAGSAGRATLDGVEVPVTVEGKPAATGRIQFNGSAAGLRFRSIAFREPAGPAGEPIFLRTRDARISGGKTFTGGAGDEQSIEAIGTDSRISWVVDLPKAGRYKVELDTALSPNCGGRFTLHLGDARLTAPSPVTGGWHVYRVWTLGSADLARGTLEVRLETLESKGGLFNLRSIRLTPE